jgi:hypothetical protein
MARDCGALPASDDWWATAHRSVPHIEMVVPAFCPPYGYESAGEKKGAAKRAARKQSVARLLLS